MDPSQVNITAVSSNTSTSNLNTNGNTGASSSSPPGLSSYTPYASSYNTQHANTPAGHLPSLTPTTTQQQWETYQQQQQQQQQQHQRQQSSQQQQHLLPPPPPPPTQQQQQQQQVPANKRTTRKSQQQQQQGYQNIVPANVKREQHPSSGVGGTAAQNTHTMSSSSVRGDSKEGVASGSGHHDDPMPSTSDFVKKLYKMLEDPAFQSVVSWGPQGDCFVVKDMNEFTKSILPRMFKHSNFASFVRQLNKYDFHKVKNTDDCQFGEHSWTFRHPDFHADRRDALENIKRKVPAQRKNTSSSLSLTSSSLTSASLPYPPSSLSLGSSSTAMSSQAAMELQQTASNLQHEVRRLRDDNEDLKGRLRQLERQYENVLVEMVGFQRGMTQQDGVMQSLIAYFMNGQGGSGASGSTSSSQQQQGGGEGEGRGKSSISHSHSRSNSSPSFLGMPPLPTPGSGMFSASTSATTSAFNPSAFTSGANTEVKADPFMDVDARSARYGSVGVGGGGSYVSY